MHCGLGWLLDPLAAVMLIMITLVGLCIFVFSTGYMVGDKNFVRFLRLSVVFSPAQLLGLVLSNSLLLLLSAGKLVGLAPRIVLIGFWIERTERRGRRQKKSSLPPASATWDFSLVCSGSTAVAVPFSFTMPETVAWKAPGLAMLGASAVSVALLIFLWCGGQSRGAIPAARLLPDAMEGPTPVSAFDSCRNNGLLPAFFWSHECIRFSR